MTTQAIIPADQEDVAVLRERIIVLERIVSDMAGWVPGFGSAGVSKSTLAAKRQIDAARSRS